MGHQHDRLALGAQPVEDVEALLLEGRVADREHLVDQHHIGVGMHHHRERQADLHPRRVVLELLVDEPLELAERDDLVKPRPGLLWIQPHHDRVDLDVVAGRQVGVEADPELDERRQPARHLELALIGPVDPSQALQERALARAVAPDDPEELPLHHLERDTVQDVELMEPLPAQRMQRPLLERVRPIQRDPERLLEPGDSDCGWCARHQQQDTARPRPHSR